MMGVIQPRSRKRSAHYRAAAFTLLELLVSMSILAVLLVLLLSIVNGSTKLWKANENRVDSYREARAAVNMLANDLASLYASSNLKNFSISTQKDKLPATPVGVNGMHGSIFFLTALPPNAQGTSKSGKENKSDLCTVGYFLGYDKTSLAGAGTGTESYNLYRYFRASDDTFTALSTGDLLGGITIDTTPTSANTELLAKNITGFEVHAYTIPPAVSPGPGQPPVPQNPVEFTKTAETPLPDMLEIKVTALNNDVAKRLAGKKSTWEDPESITRKQNDRSFTTRIYLPVATQVKATPTPSPSPTPPSP